MGLLKKPYEISLWEDVWNGTSKQFEETRTLTIGSSEMEYLGRAIEPNLVRKTNGEVSFSFKMYYQFVDTTTGETVNNPFVDYIANETKVKLKYGDEWFDLLVKNVHKDSATKSYTYQLVDQHMTELSKNGFDVQLDSKLFNNLGTAKELGEKVLQNTDWGVESEKIVQTQDEALVMLTLPNDLSNYGIYQINDENLSINGAEALAIWPPDIAGKPIYAFYSSCSGDKPYRFQFIYKPFENGQPTFSTYSDRIIADQNCQYYIDGIAEWVESSGFTIPKDFAFDTRESSLDGINNNSAISVLYRGRRYVYSQTSEYHPGLDMYLEKYKYVPKNGFIDTWTRNNYTLKEWEEFSTPGRIENWTYKPDNSVPTDAELYPVGTIVRFTNTQDGFIPFFAEVTQSQYNEKQFLVKTISSEQCYKYTKTEYVAPSLIQNVVNNADFKGTSAWRGSKFLTDRDADIGRKPASSPAFPATVESLSMYDDGTILAEAADVMLGYTTVNDEGSNWSSVIGNQNYKPYLRCGNLHNENNIVKAIVNSGTSDTVAFQQGVTEGERYVFDIEAFSITKQTKYAYGSDDRVELVRYISNNRLFPQIIVAKFDYDSSLNGYNIVDYTNLGTSEDVLFLGNAGEEPVELAAKRTVTSEAMQRSKYQIFLLTGDINPSYEWRDNVGTKYRNEYFVLIKKIQFYKLYPKENGGHYTPDENLDATEVSYVVEDRYFSVVENDTRTLDEITFAPTTNIFAPVLSADGSKKSTVNVKESNYFNAIQAIASTFECWPQLEVNHDATGKITTKKIKFKNYVGQKNHVGFKYGVNSKDIKRTIDSNQIVSKLIVKANSNEYAPNGFCTIARAPANSVKDNVLYNFDYYVSQQMLDATALQNDLHIAGETEGQTPPDDITRLRGSLSLITLQDEDWANGVLGSCTGYYPKMRIINQKLETLQKLIAEKNAPLIAETATYNTYKAMYEAAVSDLEEQQDRFFKLAGCAYNAIPDNEKQEEIMNSTALLSTLQTIAELAATEQDAKTKYETAERNMEFYSRAISTQENRQKNALLLKEVLNNMFYTRYSRFIQEGTWIDESYLDESLYYNDALSVSYNSAMPKVTYSMNVLSLAGLPGYELFDFKVGDQTFVEDTEFFGYDTTGAPIRAEVTITQTSENLDDPTKNTIQIRNYENQFEDLFQRINATVQSVQYSEGSYKKAAEFAEADAAHKFSFLNDALSAAEAYIGDTNNTVVVDTSGGTGITITDKNNAEQALRLTSGAILLKGTNPDTGEKVWKTGLTAEGISASLVNAGILNTGEINIMNGSEPTFRWDSHGITAYDFDNSTSNTSIGIDKTKGVRFDRFGLYGYTGINGENWKPTGINTGTNSVEDHSTFYLTWEGLKIKGLDKATLRIGDNSKSDDTDETIMRITDANDKPTFVIKNNGHFEAITGKIGNLTVGDLSNSIIRDNLLLDSNLIQIPNRSNDTGEAIKLYYTGSFDINQPYTLSFDVDDEDSLISRYEIGLHRIDGGIDYLTPENVGIKANGTGTYTYTFTLSSQNNLWDALWIYGYLKEGNFNSASKLFRITKAKLEKGETATAWCPAKGEEDFHNNLLEGSQKLDTVTTIEGKIELSAEREFQAVHANNKDVSANSYRDVLYFPTIPVQEDSVYTLSFMAKGTGELRCYFYGPGTVPGETYPVVLKSISSQGIINMSRDGDTPITLSDSYTQYTIVWHVGTSATDKTKHVLFRLFGDAQSAQGSTTREAWIYAPKLERGYVATEWTPHDADVPDGLLRASVDNDFSWEFNEKTGITMWNGAQGTGNPSNDNNVVFKVFNNGSSSEPKHVLYMRGQGIFEGGDTGIKATLEDSLGSYEVENLVLKAGRGFGVTVDGTIYANKGQIGDLKIGEIPSKTYTNETANNAANNAVSNLQIGGRNLIRDSEFLKYGNSASGITTSTLSDGSIKIVALEGNNNWVQIQVDESSWTESCFAEGEACIISFAMKSSDCPTPPLVYIKDGMGYYPLKGTLSNNWSTVYCQTTWHKNNDIALHLGFKQVVGTFIIKNIKLEKGNKVTEWTPAPEDAKSQFSILSTNISAKVSSEDGATGLEEGTSWSLKKDAFTVSSHTGSTTTEVLKVDKSGLTVTGIVNATEGNLGGWTLETNKLYGKTSNTYYGLFLQGGTGTKAIYAGATNPQGGNAKFYVTKGGTLYATGAKIEGNITATEGYIGTETEGWEIDSQGIKGEKQIGVEYVQEKQGGTLVGYNIYNVISLIKITANYIEFKPQFTYAGYVSISEGTIKDAHPTTQEMYRAYGVSDNNVTAYISWSQFIKKMQS